MKAALPFAAALLLGTAPADPPAAAIRIDQLGFDPADAKLAILTVQDDTPVAWQLVDATGRVRASGTSRPFGVDPTSGERVQHIDFSELHESGDGFRLIAGPAQSHGFAIRPHPFAALGRSALSFFYQQRSGVPIRADLVERADLARPAGHPHERVTCFAGTDQKGVRWPGCGYSLDVTGGWYDAGDQGKYVVNGGISAWTLLDLHERLAAWGRPRTFADGTLAIPERGNGVDDLLDEARFEVEFLLAMQVPDGTRLTLPMRAGGKLPADDFQPIDAGGLVHSKVADEAWTALPTAPADDRMRRFLYPPTTGATLNLVAVAAQAARIWRTIDPAFAARALAAAKRGWAAAERHPALYASSDFAGSGGYGDEVLDDERFWAASELFATTGDARYRAIIESSSFFDRPSPDLNWAKLDLAGLMTLATEPNALPAPLLARARQALIARAEQLLAERARSGFALPFASPNFEWGSNSVMLNRAMVLGVAWQLTRKPVYRDAAVDVLHYLLGRNALDQSFVTGFGMRTMHQPHHRFWAHAADPRYPAPPSGVLSAGPNSTAMVDTVSEKMKGRCIGQSCWVDDWRAFTMNEVAINWNAPLVWVATFADATAQH